jgi:polar amino acid transport system substrate-binding protein
MKKKQPDYLLIILVVAAVLVGIALLVAVINHFTGQNAPAPTPPPPPTSGDPWQRIQASGKMIVGTSLDYPPFGFYNDNFQPDGFDVALIREIGQTLGVQVELKDMAFDGLGGALQLGQIDLAIAAISVTPEREAVFDFSNVYFVGEDAILANQNANVAAINNVTEMAFYRVGVQRATVHERWLRETLVETGIMPAANLLSYQQATQAVDDVRQGRIDLVVLDLPPAETAVSAGGLKLVGQGLNQQRLAIGLVNGAATTQGQLNNALTQLQNSGRLNALVQQYLGLNSGEIIPLPTPPPVIPTPVATATPVACIDQMTWVQDLNLDDRNMTAPPEIQPGQTFRKWWRIRNSGTCTWDGRYALTFVGGNSPLAQMGGQPTPIQGTVAPGQTHDIFVDLVAPLTPGTYQSFWSMRNSAGQTFGDRIWVGIRVPSPATPTPAPTQTPSANIEFSADRTNIRAGECVTFRWNISGAQSVAFYQRGQNWQNHPVPPSGASAECPPQTIVYELRVVWQNGSVEVREITIFVQPVVGVPVIHQFTVSPADQITLGQCVTLNWWVEGQVSNVRLLRDSTVIWQSAPVSGNTSDCPSAVGTATYRIEATGPGGQSNRTQAISVIASTQPTPTTPPIIPTPTTAPPQIVSFNVGPTQIVAGDCVNINWTVGGAVSRVRLLRNGAAILDNAPSSGANSDCLNSAGTFTYRLEATGPDGRQDVQDRVVTVTAPPPPPPLGNTSWRLLAYYDGFGALVSVISGTELTALFGNDGSLTGTGGCNTFNGRYTTQNDRLTISNFNSTQIFCADPPGIMDQENRYLQLLPQAQTYQITNQELTLRDGTGQIILRYTPLATPR